MCCFCPVHVLALLAGHFAAVSEDRKLEVRSGIFSFGLLTSVTKENDMKRNESNDSTRRFSNDDSRKKQLMPDADHEKTMRLYRYGATRS
jgi:hypothetical protein